MKVISLSLWGNDGALARGAVQNIHLARVHYPGWKVRIYCRDDVSADTKRIFTEAGADVRTVVQQHGAWEGLFWRFYPIWDIEVTHTISRDCDSRVNPREAAAVAHWLESGTLFHTMRDHYQHIVPILGGMLGCCHWPEMWRLLSDWTKYGEKGDDQLWLTERVWPLVREKCLAHDRYPGRVQLEVEGTSFIYDPIKFFGPHPVQPFPEHASLDTRLHGESVGSRVL